MSRLAKRLRDLRAGLRRERAIVREHRPEMGLHAVLLERLRTNIGIDGIDHRVGPATWAHAAALGEHEARLGALEIELRTVRETALQARALATFDLTERSLSARFDADDVLVSVVLPTFDRGPYLRRAVASVVGQLHERWELLVVDTGGRTGTAEALATFDDPRIKVLEAHGSKSAVARNAALDAARGDLVAYLDDDNVLLPWWLRAVALTAREHPDRLAFYGARVIEQPPGDEAWWQLDAFDRDEHTRRNLTDTGMIAHRRSDAVRWPEDQSGSPDWELVGGLAAAGHEPLAIPVRAVLYTTSAPGRMTDSDEGRASSERGAANVARLL